MKTWRRTGKGRGQRDRPGFTLIEVMFATALIGIGVTALMIANESGSRINGAGAELTQASYLAQEMREWTLKLPFKDPDAGTAGNAPGPDGSENPQVTVDDLDDLKGPVTYSPPRDGRGLAITELSGWSQTISLGWKSGTNLAGADVTAGSTDYIRATLTIKHGPRTILTTGWLVTRRTIE